MGFYDVQQSCRGVGGSSRRLDYGLVYIWKGLCAFQYAPFYVEHVVLRTGIEKSMFRQDFAIRNRLYLMFKDMTIFVYQSIYKYKEKYRTCDTPET